MTSSSPANNPEAEGGFAALGLDESLQAALAELGYEEPTPIQRAAIPPLLDGKDVLGQAATGTGKTAAFALPLLTRIGRCGVRRAGPAALVLVPTRELAMQVSEAVHRYGKRKGVSVLPIYGGQSFGLQLRALERGVDVVVATPGRALDHVNRGTLDLGQVRFLVLDEADEMLDMGFAEDLDAILAVVPGERQTALFSATMPPRIARIAERHLRQPTRIEIAKEKVKPGELPKVRQVAYVVPRPQKAAALRRVLDMEEAASTLVFCRTRVEVEQLADAMNAQGYRTESIHGGLTQDQRDRVMAKFRSGKTDLLVATDVAARGLDISRITHVVNFDIPYEPEAYVHRIGRTGRAGRGGVAILFVEPRERRLLRNIEMLTKQRIEIGRLPSSHDVRARRLERAGEAIREAAAGGELDAYRGLVESLAAEIDPLDLAAAAVKLYDAETSRQTEGDDPGDGDGWNGGGGGTYAQPLARDEAPRERRGRAPRAGGVPERVFIGLGRNAGVRPADLVGAIANEARIPSSSIGAIDVKATFSIVEVPEAAARDVVQALRRTTIRGRRAIVRIDRGPRART